jgi:hypothetical protein
MHLWIAIAALAAQEPAAAAAAAAAPAERWESFYSDDDGSFEVDAGRLSREGDQVEAWVRQVYATPTQLGMKTFVLHNRVDCRRRRAVTFSMEGFFEDGTSIGLIEYGEHERPDERLSRQGSDGAMLRRLCEGTAVSP